MNKPETKRSRLLGRGSISAKLLFAILFVGTCTTVFTTCYLLYEYYLEQSSLVDARMEQIEKSYNQSLVNAIWNFESRQIESILEGIIRFEAVHYAEVSTSYDQVFSFGEKRTNASLKKFQVTLARDSDTSQEIGTLYIESNLKNVNQRVAQQFWVILISQGVKTFFVSLFILFIVHYMVSRHLTKLAQHTSLISLSKPGNPAQLYLGRRQRAPSKIPDELDILADAVNTMQERLHESVVDLHKSEERFALAMRGANDGLWDWDLQSNEVYYSPRWKSMLGYSEEDIGDSISALKDLIHEDDKEKFSACLSECMQGRQTTFEIEFRLRNKGGDYVDILSRAFVVSDEDHKVVRIVGTHLDITSRKNIEKGLQYQALHDNLTGLGNRRLFEQVAERLINNANQENSEHVLCFMDLDKFKIINDSCGHAVGDELLRQYAVLLKNKVRVSDVVVRLGGDEFAILMEYCSIEHATRVIESLQKEILNFRFSSQDKVFSVGASISLVVINRFSRTVTELIGNADAACHLAKSKGGNHIHTFYEGDQDIAKRRGEMQLAPYIQKALDENRLVLHAQPIIPLKNGEEKYFELLVRMLDEQGNIVSPGAFLPSAERYNLIGQVDRWVVKNALIAIAEFGCTEEGRVSFTINVSGLSVVDEHFHQFVSEEIKGSGVRASQLCFEITETAAISNFNIARQFISLVRGLGCKVALDDFGSGASSFAYLKNMDVDFLKIDGVFVRDIIGDAVNRTIVTSAYHMGKVKGIKVIAEFVEDEHIVEILKEIGIDYAQGYALGKPKALDEVFYVQSSSKAV